MSSPACLPGLLGAFGCIDLAVSGLCSLWRPLPATQHKRRHPHMPIASVNEALLYGTLVAGVADAMTKAETSRANERSVPYDECALVHHSGADRPHALDRHQQC